MGRTPPGVRGLKFCCRLFRIRDYKSHPTRGAWIEINGVDQGDVTVQASHPTRGAWIEISDAVNKLVFFLSHPTRGAWIEIPLKCAP